MFLRTKFLIFCKLTDQCNVEGGKQQFFSPYLRISLLFVFSFFPIGVEKNAIRSFSRSFKKKILPSKMS